MDRLTVTMLGRPSSGKTTFLHAMYAQLSLGNGDFGLTEVDWNRGLELDESWRALKVDGVLPEPTDENPQFNEFELQCLDQTVATLEWADFRGGALRARTDRSADASVLHDRLARSDNIVLVLDGAVLGDATFPDDIAAVGSELGTERMSAVLRDALRRRPPELAAPSVTVLITKADRILEGVRIAQPRLEEIFDAVVRMLPVIENAGLSVMICPVRVGRFGRATGTIDPSTVAPEWLHQPVLFAVMHHCYLERDRRAIQTAEAMNRVVAAEAELADLATRAFGGMRFGARRQELAVARDRAREEHRVAWHAHEVAGWSFERLRAEIDAGIPIYHRGRRVVLRATG